jgi:myosin heavy subunit
MCTQPCENITPVGTHKYKVTVVEIDGGRTLVRDEHGTESYLDEGHTQTLVPCVQQELAGVEDIATLQEPLEPLVFAALQARFNCDRSFTRIGPRLTVYINPCALVEGCTPSVLQAYVQGQPGLSPHAYGVAAAAHMHMLTTRQNQAILVTGQTRSGSSDVSDMLVQYFAEVSRTAKVHEGVLYSNTLEQYLLHALSVLEAFGNAKSIDESNSRRYGKWQGFCFSPMGELFKSWIRPYQFEKTRISSFREGERTFNVFYQVMKA